MRVVTTMTPAAVSTLLTNPCTPWFQAAFSASCFLVTSACLMAMMRAACGVAPVALGSSVTSTRSPTARLLKSRGSALVRSFSPGAMRLRIAVGGNLDLVHIAGVGFNRQRVAIDGGNAAEIAHHLRACGGRRCQQQCGQGNNSKYGHATRLAFNSHKLSCSTDLGALVSASPGRLALPPHFLDEPRRQKVETRSHHLNSILSFGESYRLGAGSSRYNLPVNPALATAHDAYLLACVAGAVALLLLLVGRLRLHAALGLSVAAMALGAAAGIPLEKVPLAFTAGAGEMMGRIAIILGMGAILGQLLASSGAATALGRLLVEGCGTRGMPWALLALGILVGIPVFFEVGLVLLMPIVVDAARRSGRPPMLVGLPVLAGLSAMHCLLPPHPAALLAAAEYHAALAPVMLWGLVVGVIAATLGGPVLYAVLIRLWERPGSYLRSALPDDAVFGARAERRPQSAKRRQRRHVACADGGADRTGPCGSASGSAGDPAACGADSGRRLGRRRHRQGNSAQPVSCISPVFPMWRWWWPRWSLWPRWAAGCRSPRTAVAGGLRRMTIDSFAPIASPLVILAAAGGLSGVLRASGAAQAAVTFAMGAHMPPLLLAWALAAAVRVSMGSATVAMAVAAGILAPMAGTMGVRPELLVLATGSGSILLSHVNDSGFWLIGSLFKIDVKATLATWSVLETVLSLAGLAGTLLLSVVLK